MTDEPLVDLVIEAGDWQAALPEIYDISTMAAELALNAAGVAPETFSVCLLACDDNRIATLNADHRGKSVPTNVLSWPAAELAPDTPGGWPRPPVESPLEGRTSLGDVAIALQTVEREAASASISLKNHTIHLILHGVLHLLGFDHQTPMDAERMEGLESRALLAAGLPDPYLES